MDTGHPVARAAFAVKICVTVRRTRPRGGASVVLGWVFRSPIGTASAAAEFMNAEWPPHDAPIGIAWSRREIVLVATRGIPVGVACGVVIGGLGEQKQLLVKIDHVRRRVGSQLLEEFERRCAALGCHKLRLETADYQARPFYERHGFMLAATLTEDRFGRDWFVMDKRLGPWDRGRRRE